VSTIADGHTEAGRHRITWDGRGVAGLPVAPGLYYARLEALDRTLSRRLVMLR
jgi:flagellar hook assembly protein FlgD